ncbi:MAG TPA: MEDS domain-containing protein [Thermoanaerobaculia bacterium]|jgi:hypothetical protein|nr:MEDS domain-containing protein [Thermoanaerobaculia bacterium]
MVASEGKSQFGETVFIEDHHVCAFFRNKDEEFRTLAPFILEGLAAGEKAIHIVQPDLRERYRRRMTEAGVDIDAVESSGQLEVVSFPTFPQHGIIDQQEAIEMMDHLLGAAVERGYRRTRVIGEMDWVVEDEIRDDELIALEARLEEVYVRYDVWVICSYDLSHFSGSVVLDVMRTHPAAMIGGVFQHNPFYVPPAQMLEELRGRSGLVA